MLACRGKKESEDGQSGDSREPSQLQKKLSGGMFFLGHNTKQKKPFLRRDCPVSSDRTAKADGQVSDPTPAMTLQHDSALS
jgi:hypothetical protein